MPNGLWPAAYDGSYLFADGGSGRIWNRRANGSVDYNTPFATDAFGISDMTFGFDAAGRMVLYYVQVGGSLRAIASTAPLASMSWCVSVRLSAASFCSGVSSDAAVGDGPGPDPATPPALACATSTSDRME